MDSIETIWQIPGIAHFCFLFREAYNLPEFEYEDLEEALLSNDLKCSDENSLKNSNLNPNLDVKNILNQYGMQPTYLTNEPKDMLIRLICILLRGYFGKSIDINLSNWEDYLVKIFESCDENQVSPFYEKRINNDGIIYDHYISFNQQPIEKKAEILFELCVHNICTRERSSKINELEEDELRVEPIGQDAEGCVYWYFYGTRLYKENKKIAKKIVDKKLKMNKLYKSELKNLKSILVLKKSKISNKKDDSLNRSNLNDKINDLKNENLSIIKPEISVEEAKEAWCLVCKTENDWIELTKKFKNSRNHYEKELYEILENNFLPNIHKLFLKSEQDSKKKLRYLYQRNSSRLLLKRFQQEEQRLRELEPEIEKSKQREIKINRRNANKID